MRFILDIDLGREQSGFPELLRAARLMKYLADDIERNTQAVQFDIEGTKRYGKDQGSWKLIAEKRDLRPRRMRMRPEPNILFLSKQELWTGFDAPRDL